MTAEHGLMKLFMLKEVVNLNIQKIRVGGFRNIAATTLYFDKITALVGLNGYGKSNVMDAIDFGFDFLHAPKQKKALMMTSKNCIPILRANAGRDYEFEVELIVASGERQYIVRYGFAFAWETDASHAKIKTESLEIKVVERNQRFNTFISREEESAFYRSSETGRCSKRIKIESDALVINKLLAIDNLYYADVIQQLNDVQFFIERHLDANPSFLPAPFVIKGFQELELQGMQSIPRAIYFLKKEYNDKYELLIDAFKQLFPDISDVDVEEIKLNRSTKMKTSEDSPFVFTDSIHSMTIMDDKLLQPIGFEHLSDGTKRVFLMLTVAIIADIKGLSLMAIEEPENSIHPGLFQQYLDVLCQLVNNCKIVITSHSPYIVQYLDPECIYLGMPSDTREVDFKRIAHSKVSALLRDAAEYDRSTGDYIFNLFSSANPGEYLREYVEGYG